MQDSGLDIREEAEDFSLPWLLPRLMASVRQEDGRFRGERDPGYLREWLRIQALTASLPSPLWGVHHAQREVAKRRGFSAVPKCASESVWPHGDG